MQTLQEVEQPVAGLGVTVESGPGLERRLHVRVPAERIEREVEARLRSVARTANIKGFRPGKVPEKVIRQRYGDQVRQDVLQDVIRTTYNEALVKENLQPVGEAEISGIPNEVAEGEFAYTARFEVFPEIKIQGLESITVSRPEPAFDDADVEFITDNLRRQRRHFHATDREARTGDRVTVDFEGRLNGEPMEGGKGEQVQVELGAGRLIEDFERQLAGLKSGDVRDIEVRFPADYPNRTLAGQTAEFHVQVTEVAEEHLPELDEELIKGFGIASGAREDLVDDIRKNMTAEFAARARAEVKRQLMEHLLKTNPVEIPIVLVEQEATSLQSDAMRNLGITDVAQAPALESFREAAERRVRLGLLIGAVIREQDLVVDRDKVRERIDSLAAGYEKPEEIRKLYFQTPRLLTQVENAVLEEQVVDWLVGRAVVTAAPTTFRALVGE